ncbi:MAG: hypothetical protein IPH32_13330 [Bacteroidetes bacterium]|nr:hypothetical protein [Bacteroidota bacterium]
MIKNKYDTSVIFLYAIGKENLLPTEFRKQIPYSTISTWRKTNYSKYLGHEYRYHFDDAFKAYEVNAENRQLRLLLFGLARSWITLSHILMPLIKQANGNKELQLKVLTGLLHLSCKPLRPQVPIPAAINLQPWKMKLLKVI